MSLDSQMSLSDWGNWIDETTYRLLLGIQCLGVHGKPAAILSTSLRIDGSGGLYVLWGLKKVV
jgi:hypothetical protein